MAENDKNRRNLGTADELTEGDFADDKMGRNSLQGDDQESVRNQRHDQPDAKREADDVLDSFEKMDKETRAREDLGKGARSGKNGHPAKGQG
jgi:hypothetical protein